MADGRLAVDPYPRLIPEAPWPDVFRPLTFNADHEDTKGDEAHRSLPTLRAFVVN